MTRSAHAKINLGLSILRRRPDGYHDLETIFAPIAIKDEITFERTDGPILLEVTGGSLSADASNLCLKAAFALRDHARSSFGVRMVLQKNIPVGAGLGGGSSDAACVLRALNELWHLGWTTAQLHPVAVPLGADVPYFLIGGFCFASGTGEILDPLPVSFPYWIVTIVPPVQVSTAWAYGRLRITADRTTSGLRESFYQSHDDLPALERSIQNDFEEAVVSEYPAIAETMRRLRDAGLLCVRMSGSGSAVFGLTRDKETAFRATQAFSPPHVVSLTPPAHP